MNVKKDSQIPFIHSQMIGKKNVFIYWLSGQFSELMNKYGFPYENLEIKFMSFETIRIVV